MASEYRQRDDGGVWHHCTNCSDWPDSDFSRQSSEPSSGDLCEECQSKEDNDNCE
jgi:hypothetical protein